MAFQFRKLIILGMGIFLFGADIDDLLAPPSNTPKVNTYSSKSKQQNITDLLAPPSNKKTSSKSSSVQQDILNLLSPTNSIKSNIENVKEQLTIKNLTSDHCCCYSYITDASKEIKEYIRDKNLDIATSYIEKYAEDVKKIALNEGNYKLYQIVSVEYNNFDLKNGILLKLKAQNFSLNKIVENEVIDDDN